MTNLTEALRSVRYALQAYSTAENECNMRGIRGDVVPRTAEKALAALDVIEKAVGHDNSSSTENLPHWRKAVAKILKGSIKFIGSNPPDSHLSGGEQQTIISLVNEVNRLNGVIETLQEDWQKNWMQCIPDTMAVVPKEPTIEMVRQREINFDAWGIYKAMLSAAPKLNP